ncbi:MAG: PD-(D/E)XK nuclease superfamily protein [Ostreibacterium sp.]
MTKSSGSIANSNVSHLEETIENIFKRDGYTEIDKNRFLSFSQVSEQPIYSKQVIIGETIYETIRKCDLIIFHPKKFKENLVIECKWQQSAGSVDEKYPFLVLNIKKLGVDTIIILDGGGFKKGAETWLKSEVNGCLKKVINLAEFMKLANKGFL